MDSLKNQSGAKKALTIGTIFICLILTIAIIVLIIVFLVPKEIGKSKNSLSQIAKIAEQRAQIRNYFLTNMSLIF